MSRKAPNPPAHKTNKPKPPPTPPPLKTQKPLNKSIKVIQNEIYDLLLNIHIPIAVEKSFSQNEPWYEEHINRQRNKNIRRLAEIIARK